MRGRPERRRTLLRAEPCDSMTCAPQAAASSDPKLVRRRSRGRDQEAVAAAAAAAAAAASAAAASAAVEVSARAPPRARRPGAPPLGWAA
jgi:hypothetical protein